MTIRDALYLMFFPYNKNTNHKFLFFAFAYCFLFYWIVQLSHCSCRSWEWQLFCNDVRAFRGSSMQHLSVSALAWNPRECHCVHLQWMLLFFLFLHWKSLSEVGLLQPHSRPGHDPTLIWKPPLQKLSGTSTHHFQIYLPGFNPNKKKKFFRHLLTTTCCNKSVLNYWIPDIKFWKVVITHLRNLSLNSLSMMTEQKKWFLCC